MSRLGRRLDRLREQAGGRGGAEGAEPSGSSVRDRLSRRQTRSRRAGGAAQRPDDAAIAERLGGEVAAAGLVEVVEETPLAASYGAQALEPLAAPLRLVPREELLDPQRALLLDTETTGLAGGTGTVAFLVGVGAVTGGCLRVRQWLLTGFAGEPALLERLAGVVGEAEAIVTYNGKAFDVPLLATRGRLAGVDAGLEACRHLDLLHAVRRGFRRQWPDCRLATAERRLLGRERLEDLPGSEAPAAWLDFLQRGDARALPGVLRHNGDDIRALGALWAALDATFRQG